MRNLFVLSLILLFSNSMIAQDEVQGRTIPSVDIKTVNGEVFNTSGIDNEGSPMVLAFWALWCKPCIRELNAIADVYEDWQDETGVKMVAVSIDDVRSMPNVGPTVNGNNWEYEVYCDPNGDFKRAMNVNMIPHLFLLNNNGEIVYQHTSYADGSEDELFELIKILAEGGELPKH